MLEMAGLIWQHYADRQIICVFTQQTQECHQTLAQHHLDIHIRIHPDPSILPALLRTAFALPNPHPHLLVTLIQQWDARRDLLQVLLQERNIITSAEVLQQWMGLYRMDLRRRAEPAKEKKIGKMEEESILESAAKLGETGRIQILEGLAIVEEYLNQEREESDPPPSFWNLHKYLT